MIKPALFLDRDGVVNVDYDYVHKKEDFHFVDGIFELVATANRAGYLVVIVTNQAGIGRGYYTEADFHVLMDWVKAEFEARGAHIDGVYFCPFHPEHGIGPYRQESEHRKPGPGMLLQAAQELEIDLPASIMVGDKRSDMEAGKAAGLSMLLHFGKTDEEGFSIPIEALSEATNFVCQRAAGTSFF
jgi:D-glycero-D-manno-heptose 1,7-bisphosphate phosphatase